MKLKKKILSSLALLFLSAAAHATVFKTVMLSTSATLLPSTTGYNMSVDSGTVRNFRAQYETVTGTMGVVGTFTASTGTFSGQLSGKGTTTNDSASAGFIGEYLSSATLTDTNFPSTGNLGNNCSIALTIGDWDVGIIAIAENNAGNWSVVQMGIGTVAGNDGTGVIRGSTSVAEIFAASTTSRTEIGMVIPPVRISISANATYYLKVSATYTTNQPTYRGTIFARRAR